VTHSTIVGTSASVICQLLLQCASSGYGRGRAASASSVAICFDEFGSLNLQLHAGKQWAPIDSTSGGQNPPSRRRRLATFTRPQGVRHLIAGYDPPATSFGDLGLRLHVDVAQLAGALEHPMEGRGGHVDARRQGGWF
jgi:hypothetical protein